MKKSELTNAIHEQMTPVLGPDGFKWNRSQFWFEKETDEAFLMYQFLIYKNHDLKTGGIIYQVEPYIWIHVKNIEDIFLRYTTNRYEFRHRSYTLGGSIFVLAHPSNSDFCKVHNGSLKYFAAEPDHIPPIVDRLKQIYYHFVKDYFEKYGNLIGAESALNSFPGQISTHNGSDPDRQIKGLIAAKLRGNPSYKVLRDFYSNKNRIAGKESQEAFALVREYLDTSNY